MYVGVGVCERACVCRESVRDTFLGLAVSGYAMYTTEEGSQDQTHGLHIQLNLTPMCNKRQRAERRKHTQAIPHKEKMRADTPWG